MNRAMLEYRLNLYDIVDYFIIVEFILLWEMKKNYIFKKIKKDLKILKINNTYYS